MKIVTSIDNGIRGKIQDLTDLPIVIKIGDVTEEVAKMVSDKISEAHNTGQPIIPIMIDSYGGDVYAALSIVGMIEQSVLPVATIVTGKAMSAGAFIAGCGHRGLRYMDPNATFMLHEVSNFFYGKNSDFKNDAQETERLNQLLFIKLADNCGVKQDYFQKLLKENNNADLYLMYDQAIKHKLVDHLGIPSFVVNIIKDVQFIQPNIEYVETTSETKASINKKSQDKKSNKKGKKRRNKK